MISKVQEHLVKKEIMEAAHFKHICDGKYEEPELVYDVDVADKTIPQVIKIILDNAIERTKREIQEKEDKVKITITQSALDKLFPDGLPDNMQYAMYVNK